MRRGTHANDDDRPCILWPYRLNRCAQCPSRPHSWLSCKHERADNNNFQPIRTVREYNRVCDSPYPAESPFASTLPNPGPSHFITIAASSRTKSATLRFPAHLRPFPTQSPLTMARQMSMAKAGPSRSSVAKKPRPSSGVKPRQSLRGKTTARRSDIRREYAQQKLPARSLTLSQQQETPLPAPAVVISPAAWHSARSANTSVPPICCCSNFPFQDSSEKSQWTRCPRVLS